jgi:hypothetical protein
MDKTNDKNGESTKNTHLARLRALKNGMESNDYSFISDQDATIEYVENKYTNENTKKGVYSSLIRSIKKGDIIDLPNIQDKKIEKYQKRLFELCDKLKKFEEENIKTESMKSKWLNWDEILKTREKLRKKYVNEPNRTNYGEYLILCLYTMIPPLRADYGDIVVTGTTKGKDNNNLLMWNKHKYFLLRSYKTSKRYGELRIDVDPELETIIEHWFTNYNTQKKFLLIKDDDTPLGSTNLTKKVRHIFERETNIPCTINIIRHSYLTHNIYALANMSKCQRNKIGRIMGHSLSTQLEYIKHK